MRHDEQGRGDVCKTLDVLFYCLEMLKHIANPKKRGEITILCMKQQQLNCSTVSWDYTVCIQYKYLITACGTIIKTTVCYKSSVQNAYEFGIEK